MNRPVFENQQLDGRSFFLQPTASDEPCETAVLLFHGFTATTIEVRPLAEYLQRFGYPVMAPLLPGHNTQPEDMLTVRCEDWLETAEGAYKKLSKDYSKIVVGGESMGALLALHLAAQHPDIVAVVVFAPAIHVSGQWRAPLLAPFIKFRPKYYLPKDARQPEPDTLPWQGYNLLPIPAAAQFYELQKLVRTELTSVSQPALIFQGKQDGTIDPQGAETVLESLGSREKQIIWLERSGHTLLLGSERNFVYDQTLQFVQRVTI